jgi:predicted nucleic acid-binding protein
MSASEVFFDTNVVLYLLSGIRAKADRAEALIAAGGVISVQVLNEFASVASRKLGMHWSDIRQILSTVRGVCSVQPISIETHDLALDLADRFKFSFYDALIVAAANRTGCKVLYSEDMQDGQRIEGLMIRNPFIGS